MKKWKWIHKWFSVVSGLFLLMWAASGIVLNHRDLVSKVDIPRNWLPANYTPENWNLASVRSAMEWQGGWLVWGNIGIWLTDSTKTHWKPFMQGMPEGMDNRRTMRVIQTTGQQLLAATQSGLYEYSDAGQWQPIILPVQDQRMMDLSEAGGKIYLVSRSEVFIAHADSKPIDFEYVSLPAAADEDGTTSLFRTLWVMHSGEILGTAGKLIVDFFGLLLIFFVLTGYIYFFFPRLIRRLKMRGSKPDALIRINRLSIKWHNTLGLWLGGFLIFTAATGIFLRPPLLIAIANSRVAKVKGTMLDHKNTWHDKLRAVRYTPESGYYLIATNERLYYTHDLKGENPLPFPVQPPVSVMGINVLEEAGQGHWLIGSFNGLFIWNPNTGYLADYLTGEQYFKRPDVSSPIGSNMISGMIRKAGEDLIFDYNRGLINHEMPMPEELRRQNFPLWNLALEVHTGRVFQHYIGPFYILIVPLMGTIALLVLFSGLVIYNRRLFVKKGSK